MALDPNIQKYISTQINSQFPRLYDEYGPAFIRFVEKYYEWMEQEGPLYDSRRAADYQDIDTTVDRFIIYFKDKFLQNIQLETSSNVDMLIKHSLDIYRSRGTIRAIDLLFRLVFGRGAKVYYPFDDVVSPSSGKWVIPKYIEVSTQDDLQKFVGVEIVGNKSGATAFVESWVRKKSGSKQIDVLYISTLKGDFETGEFISALDGRFPILECPTMIGSMSGVLVTTGGLGFNVGDTVPIVGSKGYGGIGLVSDISTTNGLVQFQLIDGGFGFTSNAQVLISQYVLSLENVVAGNPLGVNYFVPFETIYQPMAMINYQGAVGGYFANNDTVYAYYANGVVKGTGVVLSSTNGASTNGVITVAPLSGNLQSNAIYNTSNAISANIPVSNGYVDVTASANVISESTTFTADITNISGTFQLGEEIYQNHPVYIDQPITPTAIITSVIYNGAIGSISVKERFGVWTSNTQFTGRLSGSTATLGKPLMTVGVINTTSTFIGDTRAPIYAGTSNTTGDIPYLNQGTGAGFLVSPTLQYPETVVLASDLIAPYANVAINALAYGFPNVPSANLSSALSTTLTSTSVTVGRLTGLIAITPGTKYTLAPMVRVYEGLSYTQNKPDTIILTIANSSSQFAIGELISQSGTGAKALVQSANTTALTVKRMTIFASFALTSNSTTLVIGSQSGSTANIISISDYVYNSSLDLGQRYLGLNSTINANTIAGVGSLVNLTIKSSGWGYEDGESVTISSNTSEVATGEVLLGKQGHSIGFYRDNNGFMSSTKKIQDSDFYQVSSYEIQSAIDMNRYKDMLESLLHVAGTKAFGTFVLSSIANCNISVQNASITQVIDPQLDFSLPAQSGLIALLEDI